MIQKRRGMMLRLILCRWASALAFIWSADAFAHGGGAGMVSLVLLVLLIPLVLALIPVFGILFAKSIPVKAKIFGLVVVLAVYFTLILPTWIFYREYTILSAVMAMVSSYVFWPLLERHHPRVLGAKPTTELRCDK